MRLPFRLSRPGEAPPPAEEAGVAQPGQAGSRELAMRALDVIEADMRRAMRELKGRRAPVPPAWQAAPHDYVAMVAIREGWTMSLATLVKTYRHLGRVPPPELRRFIQDWYLRESRDLGDTQRDAVAWYAAWAASGYPPPRKGPEVG